MSDRAGGAWLDGRRAWPAVSVDETLYRSYYTERASHSAGTASGSDLHGSDLYLACACAHGDPAALAAFHETLSPAVTDKIRRMRSESVPPDELLQMLYERLFVASPDAAPRITEYTGHGALRTWVLVVASRMALNVATRANREVALTDAAIVQLVGASGDTEMAYLRSGYRAVLREAVEVSLQRLASRERTLLRLAFIDQLSVDALGRIYKVHRATVARWVVKAHTALAESVRRELLGRLNVEGEEYASIVRLAISQLDMTLERFLREEGGA